MAIIIVILMMGMSKYESTCSEENAIIILSKNIKISINGIILLNAVKKYFCLFSATKHCITY